MSENGVTAGQSLEMTLGKCYSLVNTAFFFWLNLKCRGNKSQIGKTLHYFIQLVKYIKRELARGEDVLTLEAQQRLKAISQKGAKTGCRSGGTFLHYLWN